MIAITSTKTLKVSKYLTDTFAENINTEESSNEQNEIAQINKDYSHTVNELKEYVKDSQKFISFLSLILTVSFIVVSNKKPEIEAIYPIVPILSFIIMQYLLAIHYAYRVREIYAHKLEVDIKKLYKIYPALYSEQINQFYYDLRWWEHILHPFKITIVFTFLLISTIAIYCISGALTFMKTQFGSLGYNIYIGLCLLMLLSLLSTLVWSSKKLYNKYAH